jgi:hypothetical protein
MVLLVQRDPRAQELQGLVFFHLHVDMNEKSKYKIEGYSNARIACMLCIAMHCINAKMENKRTVLAYER